MLEMLPGRRWAAPPLEASMYPGSQEAPLQLCVTTGAHAQPGPPDSASEAVYPLHQLNPWERGKEDTESEPRDTQSRKSKDMRHLNQHPPSKVTWAETSVKGLDTGSE
ncbi:hypothetical protein KIL84_004369 [Mauremys mutica]|uniref:Uncharacterized protein n=1 Tax=Mauremys mutica TaxID=74926 RepID=A0A9D4AZY9_9SAUR|nr:hypothetical protein KIL84_004369 [Mauremys mutica]